MQLPLPTFEAYLWPWCCVCQKQHPFLGQYSPTIVYGVCRECSLKYPLPIEVFTRGGNDRLGIKIDPQAEYSLREQRVVNEEFVRQCATGDIRPVQKLNISYLQLRNGVRRSKAHLYNRWHAAAQVSLAYRQMQIPMCERCGQAHGRLYEMRPGQLDYWSHCQRCEDEMAVEALRRHRGIFGGDDAETILDRLYRSHSDLFERGVLPDYWFELMRKEASCQP